MSVPTRKLEVPPIPGYHLYWFLETNVPRAVQGGYEFVNSDEVTLNQKNVATDKMISGNADLGSQVKVVAGASESGGAEHLVLMKIRQEWYDADRQAIEERNAQVMRAIFKEEQILGIEKSSAEDREQMYARTSTPNIPLFHRKRRK
jgi:hypothetical protein